MDMDQLIKDMLNQPKWAVVGATQTKEKFGYRIWRRLTLSGYETYAVNPFYQAIDASVCYPSLKALPVVPDCVNMVVTPDKAIGFIDEAIELGIKRMWFQPGTFDDYTIDYAEKNGILTVFYNCILVELGRVRK